MDLTARACILIAECLRPPDSVFSTFFRYGQVIETFRGKGIFQPAIDMAIEKLNRGEWVSISASLFQYSSFTRYKIHLFGEGKVNQDSGDFGNPNAGRLLRFKWGMCVHETVDALRMGSLPCVQWSNHDGGTETPSDHPHVADRYVPSPLSSACVLRWGLGFDKLMPEGRSAPFKFFPRPGAALSITFGKPVPSQDIQNTLSTLVRERRVPEVPAPSSLSGGPVRAQEEERSGVVTEHGWLGASVSQALHGEAEQDRANEIARVRSAVTEVIQREVETLGKAVMGLHG